MLFFIEIVGNVSKHLDVLLNFWAKIFSGQLRGSSGKRLLSKQMGESAAQVAQKNGQNIYSMATAHKRWRNRKCAKSTPAQGHAHLYIVQGYKRLFNFFFVNQCHEIFYQPFALPFSPPFVLFSFGT